MNLLYVQEVFDSFYIVGSISIGPRLLGQTVHKKKYSLLIKIIIFFCFFYKVDYIRYTLKYTMVTEFHHNIYLSNSITLKTNQMEILHLY